MRKKQREKDKVPLVVNITGTCGKTTTARIIERVLTSLHYKVGLASSVGLHLNGTRVETGDCTGPDSFDHLRKKSNQLDVIICENVLRHIRLGNLYPALADICLITTISDDHIHQTQTRTVQEIAEIKSKLIDRCKPSGIVILNGDNKFTKYIVKSKKITNLIVFTANSKKIKRFAKEYTPTKIYYLSNKKICKQEDETSKLLLKDINALPLTLHGKLKFNITNILAAVCVLDNLNLKRIDTKNIESKLSKLSLDYADLPGRFNIFNFGEFTVILDDAHNPESYKSAFKSAKQIKHKRLVSVIKASSTRTNRFIRQLGTIAALNSDYIYIKESFDSRSKKRKQFGGKVAALLKEGIDKTGFDQANYQIILDEAEAVKAAIKNAQKGDLILVFGYRVDKLHKLILKLQKDQKSCLKKF